MSSFISERFCYNSEISKKLFSPKLWLFKYSMLNF